MIPAPDYEIRGQAPVKSPPLSKRGIQIALSLIKLFFLMPSLVGGELQFLNNTGFPIKPLGHVPFYRGMTYQMQETLIEIKYSALHIKSSNSGYKFFKVI